MKLTAFAYALNEGVAHITFNQAERGNPIDRTFAREFNELATECSVNRKVRAVLIDAKGQYFSVGGDLNSLASSRDEFPRFVQAATADVQMAISRFARMNAPVVIAVHALAAGGSVALVAAADFALAAPSARFYAAYTGIGIVPDSGGSYYLPRRLGLRRTTQFLMMNETLSADEAVATGLINRVVDAQALSEQALALATKLAQGPTVAFGEIKNLLISSTFENLESQLENEARAMGRVARTEDTWHAMRAVVEKRKPAFEGR